MFSHLVEQEEFFPANLEQPNYAAFPAISKPGHQENVAQCVWIQLNMDVVGKLYVLWFIPVY